MSKETEYDRARREVNDYYYAIMDRDERGGTTHARSAADATSLGKRSVVAQRAVAQIYSLWAVWPTWHGMPARERHERARRASLAMVDAYEALGISMEPAKK